MIQKKTCIFIGRMCLVCSNYSTYYYYFEDCVFLYIIIFFFSFLDYFYKEYQVWAFEDLEDLSIQAIALVEPPIAKPPNVSYFYCSPFFANYFLCFNLLFLLL